MSRPKPRRRPRSDHEDASRAGTPAAQQSSLSENPNESGSPSWRRAALLITSVVAAILVMSFILLRMQTSADVAAATDASVPTTAEMPGAEAAESSLAKSPLPAGSTSDQSTASIRWICELPYGTHGSPRLYRNAERAEVLIAFGDEKKRLGGAMGIDVDSGEPRWQSTSQDEMFTLPMPLNPWPKVEAPWIVGGRNGQLYCIDARNGEEVWKFQPSGEDGRSQGIFNFFTGRPVADVDGDGFEDFLVPNGGDSRRGRFASRPPGHLFVVSGASGDLIHRMLLPDQRETYFSPLFWNRGSEVLVVFGSGGETFPGALWTVPMQSVRAGSLDGATELVESSDSKGAVAPPSLADLDHDGTLDLVAVPFDGRLIVISGRTLSKLWEFSPRGVHESRSSPAIADFDGDGDLDIGYVTQLGVFPRWSASQLRVFDGRTGEVLWAHEVNGNLSAASPLALDVDADGKDELFFIDANPALLRASMDERSVSRLQMVHVDEGKIVDLATIDGFNEGTGWIGDADGDGQLDWMIPLKMDGGGGRLVRVDLPMAAPQRITWGGYLGTKHDGIYHADLSN